MVSVGVKDFLKKIPKMAHEELQAKKFVETLMADFKLIHNEAKKKFPAVKEVVNLNLYLLLIDLY